MSTHTLEVCNKDGHSDNQCCAMSKFKVQSSLQGQMSLFTLLNWAKKCMDENNTKQTMRS